MTPMSDSRRAGMEASTDPGPWICPSRRATEAVATCRFREGIACSGRFCRLRAAGICNRFSQEVNRGAAGKTVKTRSL